MKICPKKKYAQDEKLISDVESQQWQKKTERHDCRLSIAEYCEGMRK